ncbi:MAG: PstS family phosphate ABC transporter substrate-binding protein [Nitrospirota bacterium]
MNGHAMRLASALYALFVLGLTAGARAEHDGVNGKPVVEPEIASYAPRTDLSGRILTIAGSNTMQPLLAKLASGFTKHHPDVRIVVEDVGSDEAIREFIIGYSLQRRGEKARKGTDGATELNVLASSRELTEKEIKAFTTTNGYAPLAIPIAMDAVTIYVHRSNPVQGLTLAQVDAIFSVHRKRGFPEEIKTWGQAGVQEAWHDQPIHLYGRDKDSGTRRFFQAVALLDGDLKEEVKEQPGSASEILAIARDPLGIGYAGVGFQSSLVRRVPLAEDAGKPFVKASTDSVLDGSYPLRRHLYLYVDKAPGSKLDPIIEEFLKFANSREGQQTVVQAQLYPLSKREVANNLAALSGGPVAVSMQNGFSSR